ncbi:hypothetical protein NDU88_007094 [Pleurodeles waltl]|uniref:Uncharacterized protein n=1 Tax=Pleurodeles waltl TaxID=8319 RepID=A0AAV7NVT5_PLEWA|nr:hypothetical protein NDU88_007094 [Pleurodeles waltl]
MNDLQIRMTADFSKETSDRRKAFLALRSCLRQLEIKFGLFEPARMWITKNNVSKDFYDSTDLSLYLDSISDCSMDMSNRTLPQAQITQARNPRSMETTPERLDHDPSVPFIGKSGLPRKRKSCRPGSAGGIRVRGELSALERKTSSLQAEEQVFCPSARAGWAGRCAQREGGFLLSLSLFALRTHVGVFTIKSAWGECAHAGQRATPFSED